MEHGIAHSLAHDELLASSENAYHSRQFGWKYVMSVNRGEQLL